ncbi:phage portal protein [Nocardioides nematodiphilus]|uniref:phage portal protein n=1 Tax=Nocardioides nematodiphilus TaxID=2849669 RepID=UPI001CD9CE2B|nr:phage portal protein [Nocardioides nematodiphilus]MCA1984801.1 phage portal protein [Nocardioides nematodiphilus]
MGFVKQLFSGKPDPVLSSALVPDRIITPRFAVDIDSGVLYGTPSLDDFIYGRANIAKAELLSVPAVKRARDLICSEIGKFPLKVYDPNGRVATNFSPNIIGQQEAGVTSAKTITQTVEDMLLSERAWWKVTAMGWHGKPAEVRRLDPESVTVQPKLESYSEGSVMVWPEVPGLIRFDSPSQGLLSASPAIRACIALNRLALQRLDGTPAVDYFTVDGDVDPFDDDTDAQEFLNRWRDARRAGQTGIIPSGLSYQSNNIDPDKLQLNEARQFAVLEVARLTGIDAEDLSVSTTSRTYANMQDRRRERVESVLGPYMTAIESRLSMPDVTPQGYTVAFDTSSYLRADDLTAAQADQVLIASGVLTANEARAKRGLDPIDQPAAPALPASTQENANA